MERRKGPLKQMLQAVMRSLGWMLLLFKTALITLIFYSYCYDITQIFFIYSEQNTLITSLVLIWGLIMVFMIIFNFIMASFTSPGYSKDVQQELGCPNNLHQLNDDEIDDLKNQGDFNICKKCVTIKPQRAHHCSVCDACVLKLDHHCPWINNCVGFYNQRYFLCLLLWLAIGTTVMAIFYLIISQNDEMYQIKRDIRSRTHMLVQTLCYVLSIVLILFSGWNWYLNLIGSTAIEYWGKKLPNETKGKGHYDFGSSNILENIEETFGTRSILKIIFIPDLTPLQGNGYEWSKKNKNSKNSHLKYSYRQTPQFEMQEDYEKQNGL